MKKASKIIIGIVVVLVALVIGLVVLAKVLITPERVRATVVPMAEKALARDVSLGEIQVSLFSGIELHDLTVSEQEGGEAFIASDLVRLRYQLLPLLAMRVVIDEVLIEAPRIRVERFAGNRYNFSDLLGEENTADSEPGGSGADASEGIATPLGLLVTEVRITDGQLVFFDHLVNGKAPYRHEITAFNLSASDITLDGKVPVTVSGKLNDAKLDLQGTLGLQPPAMHGDLTLTGLDALQFKHYFEDALPGTLDGLLLGLETSFEGSPEQVTAVGRLTADNLNLTLTDMPEAPLEDARIGIDYDLAMDLGQDQLTLDRLEVDFNGIKMAAKGSVATLTATPRADLTVDIPNLDLRTAVQALPSGLLGPSVAELDPAGQITAQATLGGSIDQPQQMLQNASLTLDKVQASAGGQRPSLDGRLLLENDQLRSENLLLGLGENQAEITLTVSNLFQPVKVVRADLRSERFLLDPLLGGAAAAGSGGSETEPAAGEASKLGPFDIPVRAEGEIRIAETVYKGMTVQDFAADYSLRDNVLTISRMDGRVAGGQFTNSGQVDLGREGLAYTADLDLQAIQANPLLSAFAPAAAGVLFGQLDLALGLEGAGTEWPTIRKQLDGKGNLLLRNGKLVSPELVNGLANVLNLGDLKELVFDTFKGNLRIENGKVLLDGSVNSSRIKLYPKGSIGLDGSLDMGLDTRLNPELAARADAGGKVTRYLKDDQGWTRLPLQLGGSFGSPSFGLDAKGLQQSATQAVKEEIGKKLGEKLLGKPKSDSGSDETEQQEEPAAQKLLKGLFGQ